MAGRDIIVVGASAGGIEALMLLARELPAGFPAAIFVVCHIPPANRSLLPDLLSRSGPLLASHAATGEHFYPGHIYVAPPDHHMLLGPDGQLRLSRGAREDHHRPAIDPLFRSAARQFGQRVIAVILTGSSSDGTAGLMAVRSAGGVAIAQDPKDALIPVMPYHAAKIAGADYIVPLKDLAPLLVKLVHTPVPSKMGESMTSDERMTDIVNEDVERHIGNERRGEASFFVCPECSGELWQINEDGTPRFRCHVGHKYYGETLLAEQSEALEAALWTAVRTYKERSVLSRQLAEVQKIKGNDEACQRFQEQAAQSTQYAELIQRHILGDESGSVSMTRKR